MVMLRSRRRVDFRHFVHGVASGEPLRHQERERRRELALTAAWRSAHERKRSAKCRGNYQGRRNRHAGPRVSVTALTWAFSQTAGSPTMKAVLVALADQSDDERYECFPGQELIAERTELSLRTVRRALDDLEVLGFVRRERRYDQRGYRTSDRYVLPVDVKIHKHVPNVQSAQSNLPVTVTGGQSDHRSECPRLPATDDSLTGHSDRVTVREPSVEPSDTRAPVRIAEPLPSNLREPFAAFWQAYPRKVGKLAAQRKYVIAARRVDPAVLLAAAQRYAKATKDTDSRYVAHPATWLHQGRWEDEAARPPAPPESMVRGW